MNNLKQYLKDRKTYLTRSLVSFLNHKEERVTIRIKKDGITFCLINCVSRSVCPGLIDNECCFGNGYLCKKTKSIEVLTDV